ncbi:BQ2448_5074 [Microbotryum intermedium]|uniref:BQ2448_5074 protein n=1 Tax=Microbotryum intermedium TaxID=269621 RepID=A0A238F655_9BASI|nr:BQ2448_5074 [Microbotryum intermedium]
MADATPRPDSPVQQSDEAVGLPSFTSDDPLPPITDAHQRNEEVQDSPVPKKLLAPHITPRSTFARTIKFQLQTHLSYFTKLKGLQAEGSSPLTRDRSCFSQALPPGPSPCHSLKGSSALANDLRVKTAVKMALCEIKTSRSTQSPQECRAFEAARDKSNENGESDLSSCIEQVFSRLALSRSPQYWSSYSGYLREIVVLCSAYRRWEDTEIAREFHQSTATRLADFVDQLQELELVKREATAMESAQRARTFQEISNHIASCLEPLVAALRTSSATQLESFALLQSELLRAIHSVEPLVSHSLKGMLEQLSQMLEDVTLNHQKALEKASDRSVERTSQMFDISVALVHDAVEVWIESFNRSSNELVKEMVGPCEAMWNGSSAPGRSKSRFQCKSNYLPFIVGRSIAQTFLDLSDGAQKLTSSLSRSLDLAWKTQDIQTSNLQALQRDVSVLSEAVRNMTLRTRTTLWSKNLGWVVALATRGRFEPEDLAIGTISALLRLGVWKMALALVTVTCIMGAAQNGWLSMSLLVRIVGLIAGVGVLLQLIGSLVARIRKRRMAVQEPPHPLVGGTSRSSPMSELALEASRFALSNPPSQLRAGIGSFARPRRMRFIEPSRTAQGWPTFVSAESYGTWTASDHW